VTTPRLRAGVVLRGLVWDLGLRGAQVPALISGRTQFLR
jgi:hypothetical protein